MVLPDLRHFENRGIFHISSDPVEVLIGETWASAIYTDKGWASPDGANLLVGVEDWRNATEARQVTKDDLGQHQSGDEGRQAPKASRSNRTRKGGQKPQA